MGQLGDLLEVMSTARRRYGTLSATLYEKFDARVVKRDEESSGYAREAMSELFVQQPDRLRIERSSAVGLEFLVVLDGWRRSTYSADWGAEVREQHVQDLRRALGPVAALLDPMPLLGSLEMTAVRRDRVGNREVFRVLANPRYELPRALGSCDEEELVVDAERGVVLELVGLIDGSPARELELRDVRFDIQAAPEAFSFTVPRDEEVYGLGLNEAASLASFPLFALPRPAQQITYRGARPQRGRPESVTIEYTDVLLVETAADDLGFTFSATAYEPPRSVERGARSYVLVPGTAFFTVDGTTIALSAADADEELLLFDLADALVPVTG